MGKIPLSNTLKLTLSHPARLGIPTVLKNKILFRVEVQLSTKK